MSDYFDELDQAVAEESSSGGGILALTRVDVGFKIYATNTQLSENSPAGKTPYSQAMTFFPTGPDKASREKALEAAKSFAVQVGAKPPRGLSVQMICIREGALSKGEPVTWKDDRNFIEALWTNAKTGEMSDGAAVVKPSLKEIGLPLPWEKWAQVVFKPSPSNRQDTDKDGKPRTALVAYPVRVFASEAEAKAGANGTVETGFNLAEWCEVGTDGSSVRDNILSELAAFTKEHNPKTPKDKAEVKAKAYASIREIYGLTAEQLNQVLA